MGTADKCVQLTGVQLTRVDCIGAVMYDGSIWQT